MVLMVSNIFSFWFPNMFLPFLPLKHFEQLYDVCKAAIKHCLFTIKALYFLILKYVRNETHPYDPFDVMSKAWIIFKSIRTINASLFCLAKIWMISDFVKFTSFWLLFFLKKKYSQLIKRFSTHKEEELD